MRHRIASQKFFARPGHFSERVTARRKQRHLLFLTSFILLHSSSRFVSAGTLRTLDGKTYEGTVTLDNTGKISVTPAEGPKPPPVDLADVLHASFRNDPPAHPPSTTPKSDPLPAPWQTTGVGTLTDMTPARFRDNTFTLRTAGANVGGPRDAFCFVNQPLDGDGELVARLVDTDTQQVVAGMTARAGPGADAPHVSVLYYGDDVRFLRRASAGNANDGGPVGGHVNLPIWMRVTRRGEYVTAYLSKDGRNWERIGKAPLASGSSTALVGLAVFGRGDQPTGAQFDNVRLTAARAAPPQADAAVTASSAAAPTPPVRRGLMLRSGTLLAGAEVDRIDDTTARYVKDGRAATVPLADVARVLFRELPAAQAAKFPPNRTGVLLREGDFVEGEFKGLADRRVSLSSVLFGLSKFDTRDKASAVVVHDFEPVRPQTTVRTRDGSVYMAKAVSLDKGRLTIQDAVAGSFSIDRGDVVEISAGPGRLEPLATKPADKLDPAAPSSPGEGLRVDSVPAPSLAGPPCEHTLTLTAGSSATWNLAGGYRTFTFRCGVPSAVLPTAPVRFVVLADGKQLFNSPPQTSLSPPVTASVPVTGVHTLTLKTEPIDPHNLPTLGIWGDPSLVK